MEQIKIDIVPAGISPVAHASQFDTSRQIRFNLFNQGAAYTLTGAETVTMVVNGEEESIANTSDNYVIWDVAEEDCETSGVIACELRIVLGSMLIGSKNFFLEVEMDPYDGKNIRIVTVGPADICTFETDLAEPLISVKSAIVATGGYSDGTPHAIVGYTGLNLTACGVNLWDEEWEVGGYNNSTGVPTPEVDRIRNKNHIPCKGGMSVYITYPSGMSGGIYVYFWDNTDTLISVVYANSGNSFTFTTPANTAYMNFNTQSYYGATYNDNLSFNYPSSDTAYHAYNGTTYAVTWTDEGTVYGGEIDLTTGVLTVTHAIVDLGSLNWTYISPSGERIYNYFSTSDLSAVIKNTTSSTLHNGLCSDFSVCTTSNIAKSGYDNCFAVGGATLFVSDDAYSDAPTFKTAMSGVKLVYELATPYTVQLSATQVRALKSVNNVFGDTGETEVKYLTEG